MASVLLLNWHNVESPGVGVSVGSCLNYAGLRAGLWEVLSWVPGGGRTHCECGQHISLFPGRNERERGQATLVCMLAHCSLLLIGMCVICSLLLLWLPHMVNSRLEPWAKANLLSSMVLSGRFVTVTGSEAKSPKHNVCHSSTMLVGTKKSLVLQGVHLENPLELLNNMLPVKFRFAKHLSFPLGIASLFSNYLFLTLFSLGLSTCQFHHTIYINSCSESTLDFYTPHLKILWTYHCMCKAEHFHESPPIGS